MPPILTIARLQYDGGGDWYANPSSLPNLLAAIRQRTSLQVDKTEARVTLMDDKLWDYPFIHVTGHGNIKFSDAEVVRLREYLQRGGFLHVDDNYGLDASFRREIKRVFPDRPLVDVPLSHPIYHIVYDFPEGAAEDPRARRAARARIRHLPRRSSRRVLQLLERPREWVGRSRGVSRSAGAARSGAADGREPVRVRRHEPPDAMTVLELVDRERTRLRRMHMIVGLALAVGATCLLLAIGAGALGSARWMALPRPVPFLVWAARAGGGRRRGDVDGAPARASYDAQQRRRGDRARAVDARRRASRRAGGCRTRGALGRRAADAVSSKLEPVRTRLAPVEQRTVRRGAAQAAGVATVAMAALAFAVPNFNDGLLAIMRPVQAWQGTLLAAHRVHESAARSAARRNGATADRRGASRNDHAVAAHARRSAGRRRSCRSIDGPALRRSRSDRCAATSRSSRPTADRSATRRSCA